MNEFLTQALNPVILIFLVSTMLASGLSLTVGQIFGPFRNVRIAISVVAGSYIIIPLLAVVISRIIGIEQPLRYGLVLLAMAAGAEAGPKLTANANANVGLSVGILIVSIGITIFYVPLMLGLLLPDVHIEKGHLLMKLLLTVALPIILGLFLKSRFEKFADSISKYMHKISSVFMLLMAAIIILLNYKQILELFGTGAILAAIIFIVAGFGTGFLLGLPERATSLAMGYMHGARNASIALMIASQAFSDQPKVLLMITLVVIIMLLVLLPFSYLYKIKDIQTK
jgi:BASS family bile acid:Na+ symporter